MGAGRAPYVAGPYVPTSPPTYQGQSPHHAALVAGITVAYNNMRSIFALRSQMPEAIACAEHVALANE